MPAGVAIEIVLKRDDQINLEDQHSSKKTGFCFSIGLEFDPNRRSGVRVSSARVQTSGINDTIHEKPARLQQMEYSRPWRA